MVILSEAISKIKILKELVELDKDDEIVSKTIDKLMEYKIEQLKKDLKEIKSKLCIFEKKYKMSSKNFIKKFESGKLGDDVNFIQWSSLYDMYVRIESRLNSIRGS